MPDRTSVPAPPKGSRREEILTRATELFATQGYHGVGMRAIADAVGIRTSSLYHHFPSKDDLLAAISSEYAHSFIVAHLPILEGDDPPDQRLRTCLRDQILFFSHHRLQRMVGLRELSTLAVVRPEVYAEVRGDLRLYQHAIESTIEEGAKAGVFKTDDPTLSAFAVIGLVTSINDWFSPDGERKIEEVAEFFSAQAVDRLLQAAPE